MSDETNNTTEENTQATEENDLLDDAEDSECILSN